MAFFNGSAGLCLQSKWYMAGFISMVLFMASFSLIGAISFIYVGEVTVDQAAGVTMGFFCLGGIIVSFTAEYVMLWLTVPGTFYFQSAINLIYALIWFCSIESAGKSDKEQKLLYAPINKTSANATNNQTKDNNTVKIASK